MLAGIAVGWVLADAPRAWRGLPRWAGIAVVAVLAGTLVPGALARLRDERTDLRHERTRTHEIGMLQATIEALGGYQHIRNCGEPVTNVEYVSTLAWLMKLDVGFVGHRPAFELAHEVPDRAVHPARARRLDGAALAYAPWSGRAVPGLKAAFVPTPHRPTGVLIAH